MEKLADFFKVLGDNTRLKILNTIMKHELSVGEIATTLKMSDSAISHQLRVLKNSRLVRSRKEGKEVYYSLDDDHVFTILQMGQTHLQEKHHD